MLYTEETKKAMKIMFEKHKDQFDKSGMPYVFHPFTVANEQIDEDRTVVALLHDVIEDTDTTLEDLRKEGFNENVLTALTFLTHDDNVDYYDYVRNIARNEIAVDVKLADLKHNSNLSRLDNVDQNALDRVEKYKTCIEFLEGVKVQMKEQNEKKSELKQMVEPRELIVEDVREIMDDPNAKYYKFDNGEDYVKEVRNEAGEKVYYALDVYKKWFEDDKVWSWFWSPDHSYEEITPKKTK